MSTLEPLHYGAASDQEIDTTWQADTGAWQWKMLAADFQLHARSVLNAGDTVQWLDPTSGESVTLQPLGLNWVDNATNSRQQITQPQAVTAVADDASLYWANGYGTGRHYRYTAHPTRLLKELVIDAAANLPAPTVANPYLELEFILKASAGVTLYCDGVAWNRTTQTNTAQAIEFRTAAGRVAWRFAAPVATDAAGHTTPGILQLRRQGATRYVTVRFPKTWLDSAVYPVALDPTLDVTPDATAGMDTWLFQGEPTNSKAAFVTLPVDNIADYQKRPVLQFDLSTITAGSTINSAALHLFVAAAYEWDGFTLKVHRILSGNSGWTEAGAVWNYKVGTTAWAGSAGCATSGTDYAATAIGSEAIEANEAVGTEHTIALNTTEFASMLAANYGMVMFQPAGTRSEYGFDSSDSTTAGERPRLVVDWTASGITGTVALAAQPAAIAATGTNTPPAVTGTVAIAGQPAAIVATGTNTPPAITGTVALIGQPAEIAATGAVGVPGITGTVALAGQPAQIAAAGVNMPPAITGTVTLEGQPAAIAASGVNTPPAITGTVALEGQLAQIAAAGTNILDLTGTVAIEGQPAQIAATGTVGSANYGTASLTAQPAQIEATGTVTPPAITGTVGITGQPAQIAATGVNTPPAITGTVEITAPMAEIAATDAKIQAGRATLSDALAYTAAVSDAALVRAGVTDAALFAVTLIGDA